MGGLDHVWWSLAIISRAFYFLVKFHAVRFIFDDLITLEPGLADPTSDWIIEMFEAAYMSQDGEIIDHPALRPETFATYLSRNMGYWELLMAQNREILARLQSNEWRDILCSFFERTTISGLPMMPRIHFSLPDHESLDSHLAVLEEAKDALTEIERAADEDVLESVAVRVTAALHTGDSSLLSGFSPDPSPDEPGVWAERDIMPPVYPFAVVRCMALRRYLWWVQRRLATVEEYEKWHPGFRAKYTLLVIDCFKEMSSKRDRERWDALAAVLAGRIMDRLGEGIVKGWIGALLGILPYGFWPLIWVPNRLVWLFTCVRIGALFVVS